MPVKIINYYLLFFFSVLGGVVGVSVLTHYVSPSDYAKLSLVIALGSVIQYVVRDTYGVLFSKYIDQYEKAKNELKLINVYLLIYIFVIAPILFYFFIGESFFGVANSILFWLLFFIVSLFESLYIAFKKRYKYVHHSNIFNWLRFLFALVLYLFYEPTYISLIIGYSIGAILTIAFDYLTFDRPKNSNNNSQMLNVNKIFIASLLSWGGLFFDRFLIEYFLGEDVLGGYFVIFQIGFMPIFLIYYSSMNLLMPYLLQNNIQLKQHLGKFLILVFFSGYIVYLISLHSIPYLSILLGEGYREFMVLLPYFSLYAILYSFSNFMLLYFLAKNKDNIYFQYKLINMVGVFVFSVIGVNLGGIETFLQYVVYFYALFITFILIRINYLVTVE